MEEPSNQFAETENAERTEGRNLATTGPGGEPLIGMMLSGRYLVKRKLGHGGFGAVYLASDEKMVSRKVVVKVMHDEEMKNEWSVRKFQQEIEALARLDHPSIVGILDAGA